MLNEIIKMQTVCLNIFLILRKKNVKSDELLEIGEENVVKSM